MDFFYLKIFKCGSAMDNDLCKALIANDRQAFQKTVDNYLRKLDAKDHEIKSGSTIFGKK